MGREVLACMALMIVACGGVYVRNEPSPESLGYGGQPTEWIDQQPTTQSAGSGTAGRAAAGSSGGPSLGSIRETVTACFPQPDGSQRCGECAVSYDPIGWYCPCPMSWYHGETDEC